MTAGLREKLDFIIDSSPYSNEWITYEICKREIDKNILGDSDFVTAIQYVVERLEI